MRAVPGVASGAGTGVRTHRVGAKGSGVARVRAAGALIDIEAGGSDGAGARVTSEAVAREGTDGIRAARVDVAIVRLGGALIHIETGDSVSREALRAGAGE